MPLPTSLSATALSRLRDEPEAFARELARPMPRQPSPAARFGTRFHAWVEARFGQQDLFDPEDLPGQADAGIDADADLAELIATLRDRARSPTGRPYAVEAPFALVLDGQVVRGRIDAVYAERPTADFLVVDWKTNRRDRPTRSSSRSTGWPGPSWPACRSSGCGRRSTTSAAAASSSRRPARPGRARDAAHPAP